MLLWKWSHRQSCLPVLSAMVDSPCTAGQVVRCVWFMATCLLPRVWYREAQLFTRFYCFATFIRKVALPCKTFNSCLSVKSTMAFFSGICGLFWVNFPVLTFSFYSSCLHMFGKWSLLSYLFYSRLLSTFIYWFMCAIVAVNDAVIGNPLNNVYFSSYWNSRIK